MGSDKLVLTPAAAVCDQAYDRAALSTSIKTLQIVLSSLAALFTLLKQTFTHSANPAGSCFEVLSRISVYCVVHFSGLVLSLRDKVAYLHKLFGNPELAEWKTRTM